MKFSVVPPPKRVFSLPYCAAFVFGVLIAIFVQVSDVDFLLFIGDGRFHLESAMLANPSLPAYMYDPYSKRLTVETYDHAAMRANRRRAIETARSANRYGIILSNVGFVCECFSFLSSSSSFKMHHIAYIKLSFFRDAIRLPCACSSVTQGIPLCRPNGFWVKHSRLSFSRFPK